VAGEASSIQADRIRVGEGFFGNKGPVVIPSSAGRNGKRKSQVNSPRKIKKSKEEWFQKNQLKCEKEKGRNKT